MKKISEIPDPYVDWENLNYNDYSEFNRPTRGFKRCNVCNKLLAVNNYNFSKHKGTPDGYQYTCKECAKKQQKIYKNKKGLTPPRCEGVEPKNK